MRLCKKCRTHKPDTSFRRGKFGGLTKTCIPCLDIQAKWDEEHRTKHTHNPGTHWPTLVRNYALTPAEIRTIARAAKAVGRHQSPTADEIIDKYVEDRERRAILLGMVHDYRKRAA